MSTLNKIKNLLQPKTPTVITLGNFDGVHVGHQAVFNQVTAIQNQFRARSVAMILFPHPKELFSGSSPALLTTLEDRKKLIQQCGIQHVFDLTFDVNLAMVPIE